MIPKENYVAAYTNKHEQQFLHPATYSAYTHVVNHTKHIDHKYWLDDIPVQADLHELAINLQLRRRKAKRETVFMPGSAFFTGLPFQSLIVSDADDPEIMLGAISFSNGRYFVTSPLIKHPGYKFDAFRRMSVMSQKWARVCAAAITHLQIPTVKDLMADLRKDIAKCISRVQAEAFTKVMATLDVSSDALVAEVQHMTATGYKPVTEQFKKAFDTVNSDGLELMRLSRYSPRLAYVWRRKSSVWHCVDSEEKEVSDITQLPGDIAQKIYVLNIADTKEVIPDVGMRVSNSTYWVFL